MPDHVPVRQRTLPEAAQPMRFLALASDPVPVSIQMPAIPRLSLANWRSASSSCRSTVCVSTAAGSSRADQPLRSCLDSGAASSVTVSIARFPVDVAAVFVGATAMGGDRDGHGDDERHAACCNELHVLPSPSAVNSKHSQNASRGSVCDRGVGLLHHVVERSATGARDLRPLRHRRRCHPLQVHRQRRSDCGSGDYLWVICQTNSGTADI